MTKGRFLYVEEPGVYLPNEAYKNYDIYVCSNYESATLFLAHDDGSLDGIILGHELATNAQDYVNYRRQDSYKPKVKLKKQGHIITETLQCVNKNYPILWYSKHSGNDPDIQANPRRRVSVAKIGQERKVMKWLEKYSR